MGILQYETLKYKGPIADRIGDWASRRLGSYLARPQNDSPPEPRQLHDSVGKIIKVESWEAFILDSPFVQRLRFIRQLGVGHVLFPTSGYSRFEHSLGALQMASQMFDGLVDSENATASPLYSHSEFRWRRFIVRLAALVHDIGHCVFSHVSEKFYEGHPELTKARNHFKNKKHFGIALSASEALTLLIVQSDAFSKLLEGSRIAQWIDRDVEDIVYRVCACIAGSKKVIFPDVFLAEIVNGPVDADKLDYIARDSYTAGIPVALDAARLLSKLRLARVPTESQEFMHALAISPSGARALDELLVSRIFLYDKFYYHPKVMAAEEVIRAALRSLSEDVPQFSDPVELLDFGDDQLLNFSPEDIAARFKVSPATAGLARGCELLARVRERDLPKRAFAFAVRYLPPRPKLLVRFEANSGAEDSGGVAEVDFRQFDRELDDGHRVAAIAADIQELSADIGVAGDVFVAHQSAKRAGSAAYLPVKLPSGKLEERPSFLFKSHEWTEAYALNKATSYVFSYDERAKVHLAAERYLRESRQFPCFAPSCWIMAKLDDGLIDNAREQLPAGDWSQSRLPPNYLQTIAAKDRMRALRERFASFHNALDPKNASQLVEGWVSQFPTGDLQESAITFLEHIHFVEPSDVFEQFNRLVEERPELRKAIWVPIRPQNESGKSADQLIVDLKQLEVRVLKVTELAESQVLEAGGLVFFDDALNSGSQLSAYLQSWFDLDLAEVASKADIDPAGALALGVRTAMRQVPITFAFYAAHPKGRHAIEAVADTIGISGMGQPLVWSVVSTQDPRYNIEGFIGATGDARAAFIEYLSDCGAKLLEPRVKSGKLTKAQGKDFALGFGELSLTVVFRHSVSTGAPAALWEMSQRDDFFWMPLFPRRWAQFRRALMDSQTSDDELPILMDSEPDK